MQVVVVRARHHDVEPRVKSGRGHAGRGRRVAPHGSGGGADIGRDARRIAGETGLREDLVVVGRPGGEARLGEARVRSLEHDGRRPDRLVGVVARPAGLRSPPVGAWSSAVKRVSITVSPALLVAVTEGAVLVPVAEAKVPTGVV